MKRQERIKIQRTWGMGTSIAITEPIVKRDDVREYSNRNAWTLRSHWWWPRSLFTSAAGREAVRDLLDLQGVESVSVRRYTLRVKIGPAFYWEGLEPEVLNILFCRFFAGRSVAVERDPACYWAID